LVDMEVKLVFATPAKGDIIRGDMLNIIAFTRI